MDTSLFPADFQARLLSALSHEFSDGLDEHINGTLIHSDNFQALNLLQARYREQVKCIYIDPPYNTDASAIIYKNGYKNSSWLSLVENRVSLSKKLMSRNSSISVAIDDEEMSSLKLMLSSIFPKEIGNAVVKVNPQSRKTKGKFSPVHEYALFYGNNENSQPFSIGYSENKATRYPLEDNKGRYSWMNFIRAGNNDLRTDRPKLFYPIIVTENDEIKIPDLEWDNEKQEYIIKSKVNEKERVIFPIKNHNGTLIEKNWQRGHNRVKEELDEYRVRRNGNEISIDFKTRMDAEAMPTTWWEKGEYASANYGASELKSLFATKDFDFPKAKTLVEDVIKACTNSKSALILDYFAGSGTTAHAVINLNRDDDGKRQYILVEQGEYFDTVLKPRVQKVIYSENWKDGKPVPSEKVSDGLNGVSQIVKVLKLESYEDTLNNLQLQSSGLLDSLSENARHDYLLNYMLDIESRGSLLNLSHFAKPFDYGLNISSDSAGAYDWQKVDLVETFNYLIGAKVIGVDDKRTEQGFVAVECRLPNQHADEKTLVFWRDCERIDYDTLQKQFDRLGINPADSEYSQVYVNGDHTLETAWDGEQSGSLKILSIEDAFLSLMFEGDA
ncbi:site-specific DNA-methyltransferase [Neisseria sp.]|uniref:site-specific DNA-methyltransferase n=1 Tax=Neisseria sp. TaxID=192066 RepID=UPI0026DC84EC|nr:site-specific DNA-methyltransferase [Neisseria sp.]MDO4226585.1 site-specific DNA-methyltransferase [Neisseria sp.]